MHAVTEAVCDITEVVNFTARARREAHEGGKINVVLCYYLSAVCARAMRLCPSIYTRNFKRFLSKSKGCRVVKSTTGPQC